MKKILFFLMGSISLGALAQTNTNPPIISPSLSLQVYRLNRPLNYIEVGTLGVFNNQFYGTVYKQNKTFPLVRWENILANKYRPANEEFHTIGLRSTLGIGIVSNTFERRTTGSIDKFKSDVGIRIVLNLDDHELKSNQLEAFFASFMIRTDSLVGGTTFPNQQQDAIGAVGDIQVNIPITKKFLLNYNYIQSIPGLHQPNKQVMYHYVKVMYQGQVFDVLAAFTFESIGSQGFTTIQMGIQVNDIFGKVKSLIKKKKPSAVDIEP